MIYILIYSLIYLNAIIGGKLNNFILILLCLFSGLRYKTGLDYENYDLYFNSLPKNIWNFELGFHLLSLIAHYSYLYHYLFFSIIIFLVLYLSLKKYSSLEVSFFLIVFTYYGYWNIFSVLRQSIACVIFFYIIVNSVELSKKNKYFLYLLAFSMHYSAIFFILVIEFLIPYIINRQRIQLILVFASIFFIQFKIDSTLFMPSPWKYALEITSLVKEVKFSLRFLEMLLVFFLSFIFLRNKFDRMLVAFASVQLFFYSFFSSVSFISERLNVYFDLLYALLFIRLIVIFVLKIKEIKIMRPVASTFLTIFIGIRYYQYIFQADYSEVPEWEITNKDRFIPYQSIFNENNERQY